MDIQFRQASAAEMKQLGDLTAYVYGGAFGDGEDNLAEQSNRPEWTLCAFDGNRLVSSYATIPFTMRANNKAMPLGGVSVVGTLPEYRRRGLVRGIVERAFVGMHEAGQPVAALWASQAAIYQRYGYATGSVQAAYSVDTVDLNLLQQPDPDLSVIRCTVAEGIEEVRRIYRNFVSDRMLYLHRSKLLWNVQVLDQDEQSGPIHVALCRNKTGDGIAYAVYTLRSDKVSHTARSQEIIIRDLAWLSIDGYRALWSFLAKHDLVGRVRWNRAPQDDPLPELVAEPRMLNATAEEGVWVRVVDVEAALAQRGYETDGELVVGVADDALTPWNDGNYRLVVSNSEAEVSRTSDLADVSFSIKALASAFTGHRRVGQLAAWGMVEGEPSAVTRADALFATRHAPHSPDHF